MYESTYITIYLSNLCIYVYIFLSFFLPIYQSLILYLYIYLFLLNRSLSFSRHIKDFTDLAEHGDVDVVPVQDKLSTGWLKARLKLYSLRR